MLKFLSRGGTTSTSINGQENQERDFPRGVRLEPFRGLYLHADLRFIILIALFCLFYVLAGETASEWVYLIAAGTLALLFLGVALPLFQIADTDASVFLPGEAQADESLPIQIVVGHAILKGALQDILPLRWIRFRTKLVKQGKGLSEGFVEPCLVIHVGRKESATTETDSLKRGVYKFQSLEASTCFPFSVVWCSRSVQAVLLQKSLMSEAGLLTVYPRLVPMRARFLETLGAGGDAIGMLQERNRASQESCAVRGLRDYRLGDSPRWVHWRSTARTNRILVKEFESESSPQYFVFLDSEATWQSEEQFELAVCLAYSIIHCQTRGTMFNLLVPPADELKSVYGLPQGLPRGREILARLQRQESNAEESSEEASFQRVEQIFNETLRSRPGSIMFAILPGTGQTSVHLIETSLDKYGRPFKRPGRSQRHHALSPEMATGQHKLLAVRDSNTSARGQMIARISQIDQIGLL